MYLYLNTSHNMYCKCSNRFTKFLLTRVETTYLRNIIVANLLSLSFQATSLLSALLYRTVIILESILTTSLKISQTRRRIWPCKYSISTILKLILKIATLTFGYPTGEMDICIIPRRILALY